MKPTDSPNITDAPYRLPSRHPSAGRGERAATVDERPKEHSGQDAIASEIKRRQEALLLNYLIHRPAR
jgi:hypothetical protein